MSDADAADKDAKQPDAKQGDAKPDAKQDDQPSARWPWFLAGGVVLVFVAVILLIVLLPHRRVTTEDAYVTAHYAMVAPRVSGQIDSVRVNDNQPVRAGTLLATIDPHDLQTALRQVEANRASDRARVAQAQAQVARQPSQIRQADAQLISARARLALAQADQRRFANLAETGAGTFQQHQQADATLRQAQATLAEAEAGRSSQLHLLDGLIADRQAAEAQVGRDDAAVAQAKLNLGYTHIVAPIDGTIAQKTVQVGNQVAPGAPLLMVVPLHDVFVIANYRELELRHMRPGQPVRIHIDAYAIDLAGHVQSLAPASGATFSPFPPNNATGNFTKIVQRLPIKIGIDPNQPLARLLRGGMSAEVTVDTNLDDVVDAQRRDASASTVR
jgi:membrane fusion protein (multidrug efflux system)